MKHSIKHDLDVAIAKKVTEKAYDSYKSKFAEYSPSFRWASDSKAEVSFKAKGIAIAGSFTVLPGQIDFELDVPFLLRPFQSKAIEVVEGEVKEWIQKAKAGQVLNNPERCSSALRRALPARATASAAPACMPSAP